MSEILKQSSSSKVETCNIHAGMKLRDS